jgi:WhiB family transcriptional regulator, redox-sensing transcriptional regulator
MPISNLNYAPVAGIERAGSIADRSQNSIPRSPTGPLTDGTEIDMNRWAPRAACRSVPTDMFFGTEFERTKVRVEREKEARAICAVCPVADPCRRYAIDTRQAAGIWGGLDEEERKSAKRREQRAPRGGNAVSS